MIYFEIPVPSYSMSIFLIILRFPDNLFHLRLWLPGFWLRNGENIKEMFQLPGKFLLNSLITFHKLILHINKIYLIGTRAANHIYNYLAQRLSVCFSRINKIQSIS